MTGQTEDRVDAMPRGAARRFRQDDVLAVLGSCVDQLLRIHRRRALPCTQVVLASQVGSDRRSSLRRGGGRRTRERFRVHALLLDDRAAVLVSSGTRVLRGEARPE